MIETLKKLIVKHGETYDRYDNTELELFRRLCDALKLPYDKYMDENELFTLIAERGIIPGSGGENGGSGGSSQALKQYYDVNTSTLAEVADYYYLATNKIDYYFTYSSSSKTGIYHQNLQTGEVTQISSTTYGLSTFFESSNGDVYLGGNSNYKGIYHLTPTKTTNIYSKEYSWSFYEADEGCIYASGRTYGLVRINGTTAVPLTDTSGTSRNYLGKFAKDKDGNLYVSSSTSSNNNPGLLLIDGDNLVEVTTSGYAYQKFFYDSKGTEYVLGVGALRKENNTFTLIKGGDYNTPFEDSKGNLYLGVTSTSSTSSLSSVIHINTTDGTVTELPYTNSNLNYTKWNVFYEDTKGNVYATSTSGPGVLYLEGDIRTELITTSSGHWKIFEDSKGTVYTGCVYSGSTGYGIYNLNGNTATQIYTNSKINFPYFFESNGKVYSSNKTTLVSGNNYVEIDGSIVKELIYVE